MSGGLWWQSPSLPPPWASPSQPPLSSRKPSGCQLLKLPFSMSQTPGNYITWWKHLIFIWLLTPRSYGVAYFEDKMNNQEINMMMLFSRTLDEDPGALSLFQEFVKRKGLNETEITAPPQAEACELPRES
ncbi:major allergen Can f 1-like [Marmota marmota marmota]|uniref:major allergen Can f 1-like n=1 Tax=Marmota marmota marmota TaxID=9994 RepID=UPI002091FA8C|nr:major allergen Can f 1-like [Marmota marmota marmota]